MHAIQSPPQPAASIAPGQPSSPRSAAPRSGVGAAVLIGALALTGCSGQGSQLTIEYGDGQTATGTFEEANCTETEVSAVAIQPRHAAVSVTFDAARDYFAAQSWVYEDVVVLLETSDFEVNRAGDTITISGSGTVKTAPLPETGEQFTGEGTETFPGTFTATLECTE